MRVLVLAPSGRDAALVCQLLGRAGIAGVPCATMPEVCTEIARGAGAVVIAEEALTAPLIKDWAND